jgi:hypothetical protein
MMERQGKPWNAAHLKRIDEFFLEMAKSEGFEDYLSVHPAECGRLLVRLLRVQCGRLEEDSFQEQFA